MSHPQAGPFSIPNLLTYARILAVPVVAGFMAVGEAWAAWVAFGLYTAAAITDYFDGLLARLLNQYSDLGRMLDPIADKLIVAAVIVMLVAEEIVTGWSLVPAIVILAREFLVSGLREFLGPRNVVIHVTPLAKWKTTIQLVALGLLILVPAIPLIVMLGLLMFWAAGTLTLVTGYDYVRKGLVHLLPPSQAERAKSEDT